MLWLLVPAEAAPAVVQPRHTSEAGFQNLRCRGQGCGAVGKAMLEGYCNKCYVTEQSARFNQAASRGSSSPPLVMVSHPVLYYCFSTQHNLIGDWLVLCKKHIWIYFLVSFLPFSGPPNHVHQRCSIRFSVDAVAVRTCRPAALTCVRTAWAAGSARAGVHRRPKRRASSAAGRRDVTTMPTRKSKGIATSVTTSSRSTEADQSRFSAQIQGD